VVTRARWNGHIRGSWGFFWDNNNVLKLIVVIQNFMNILKATESYILNG
jgi:hypothetical protein